MPKLIIIIFLVNPRILVKKNQTGQMKIDR